MTQLTTSEAIVDSLIAQGVDTIFGTPGAQTYALFDALYSRQDKIKLITFRHEQAAAYMAFGYARSTGKVGVCSVVPGPGVLNTMAALCTALACNTPVLCITAQIPSDFIGKGRGHLHELPDQLGTLRSLLKWAERIERPGDAPGLMREAFRQLLSGRPGPVALETPWDVMAQSAEMTIDPALVTADQIPIDESQIAAAIDMIAEAKSPMIFVGGGALDASREVTELAEKLSAPVGSFRSGRGVVSDDHELGLFLPAAHALWPETDLLIGIGSRLEGPYMRWNGMKWIDRKADPKLIRIDIDPEEMNRFPPEVGVVGDAKIATSRILDGLRERGVEFEDRSAKLARIKAETNVKVAKVQPQVSYLNVIRDELPKDGFFVQEICQVGFTAHIAFPVYQPRTYVAPGYQDNLGFGFQTAIGVKVANPDKAVISVTGDGGFMFGVQELATLVKHDIGLVTLVFNNSGFGNVQRDQDRLMGGRRIGSDLTNPDFVDLAKSFGMAGERTDTPEGLRDLLKFALAADAPALIEIVIEPGTETSPWEFIVPEGYER